MFPPSFNRHGTAILIVLACLALSPARAAVKAGDAFPSLAAANLVSLAGGDLPAARAGFERAIDNLRDAVGTDAPETLRAQRQAATSG